MLEIHSAERADALVGALAQRLATPAADPFAPEIVAVPTRGIERWITQRLADTLGARARHSDGICANIEFPSPGRLLADAVAAASEVDPRSDPWRPERLVWALLETIDAALEEPWLRPLARHFAADPERRFTRARALAGLFDRYGNARPELIERWAQGEDDHWQAELWRRLREQVGTPSPAERLAGACERLATDASVLDLPPRLTVFGLTRLASAPLQVLRAIAVQRAVYLMLPRACGASPELLMNPLLISWGREHRGFWEQLGAGDVATHHALEGGSAGLVSGSGSAVAPTLLRAIQRDIRENRKPPGAPLPDLADARLELGEQDRSVRIHSCHGRARQVEVLREAILHRLAADPTLEPRDVIVMCPDVEAFAPLVEASFGSGGEEDDGTRALRVRIADRSLRQTNPVLSVVSRLLELPSGRVSASEVLDLADTEPVRRRFQFDDDDLAQVREWVADAGIHWGLDAATRVTYKLEQVEAGTWAAGLRRLLLGVALEGDDQALFAGVLPAGPVRSGAIDLAGRFAEFVDRLDMSLRALSGTHTVGDWSSALAAAADMLTLAPDYDAWQRRELDLLLGDVTDSATAAGAGMELALPDLRALLGQRLEGRPTRANFRTGHVTVCALTPMRSIPHRVVCLLGLDDGFFPRHSPHDGDNLLLADPRPGDRDPRAEDRQLLLDALLAAKDALIITYTGHDERTNAPRPPAVPVGELLDVIDATARVAAADLVEAGPQGADLRTGRARELVVVSHPLQPFDPRNFAAGQGPSPAGEGPWSFDRSALEGALAYTGPRHPPLPFLEGPLPEHEDGGAVALDDLVRFVERPARAFLRQRLGISLFVDDDEVDDALPTDLDGLQRWAVGQRLLEAVLAGVDLRTAALAEIARGTLPPGALGEPVVRSILPTAEILARRALAYAGAWEPRSLETNLSFADGTRLTGTVSGVRGNVLLAVSYSRLNARHRLAAWVRLLALSAAHPELPLEAVTVGRAPSGSPGDAPAVIVARLPQLGGDAPARAAAAREELMKLLALRREGLREPLQLPSLTAAAYATAALQTGGDPAVAASKVWSSSFDFDGEEDEPEHRLVFSRGLNWEQLGQRALTLWRPLLGREVVERI